MKGLLVKDLCNLRQVARQSLIVVAVLAAWCSFLGDSQLFSMMSIIYSLMLLFTAVSYDEMAQFNKYALTLPVTRKDLVRSKYVLMLFLFLAGIVTGLVGKAVLGILIGDAGSVSLAEQGFSLLSVACIYLLAFDILLPVIFRLGIEKARLFLALIFVVVFGVLFGAVTLVRNSGIEITSGMVFAAVGAGAVLTAAGLLISYFLSLRVMQKKEW